jgi:hypothetical protein
MLVVTTAAADCLTVGCLQVALHDARSNQLCWHCQLGLSMQYAHWQGSSSSLACGL